VARPKSVNLTWPVPSTRKFYRIIRIDHSDKTGTAYLWFEIAVNISQFMKFVNSSEHLADVEPCMFFLEDTRIV